ncbi:MULTISPECIES: 50S ribosomal protein L32 [Marinitoga]|jgi:large subunit ribosomal protein L32|uniref:Large ribosomal subunit protein bL32 n=1 Tax=Marinitoga hydrogenitolerans (strain DSM 16785 / JCM 12826 / AT1271) TaxID=1122195 RepID=A0A1M4X0A1_MARH1|nr:MULTISPECIES: 50S ribosomal protein L32 [Marinitoga]MBM7559452.1 large subunit ribosomal protein L32 [Marinitoga litoralis]SHE86612.1 LSU ribosomal protein L32P [Marinitoga hydrogenitolerans DSM 16785]
MAVPKQKTSRARTHRRRAANLYKAIKVNVSKCPNCGEPKLPHRVCLNCGYYNGKQILEIGE